MIFLFPSLAGAELTCRVPTQPPSSCGEMEPGWCQAHWERAGVKVRAVNLGLCAACLQGVPINPAVELHGYSVMLSSNELSDRAYYERHKEELNRRAVERRRGWTSRKG